jgi:hypothetical protein
MIDLQWCYNGITVVSFRVVVIAFVMQELTTLAMAVGRISNAEGYTADHIWSSLQVTPL